MIIKSLVAKNFMSFEELEYNFPESGLYFIGGEVIGMKEDGAGQLEWDWSNSNGAGKSAFIEALCFGLFGETLRGVGKDEVVNRNAGDDCLVGVKFEDDLGDEYHVKRFRKDAKCGDGLLFTGKDGDDLTGSNSKTTQETINKILGMNWLVFSTAVIFGSQALRFSEAKPHQKAEVLDEIMLFQIWLEAQAKVKQDLKELKVKIDELQLEGAYITSALATIKEQQEDNKTRRGILEVKWKEIDTKIQGAGKAKKEAEVKLEEAWGMIDSMTDDLSVLDSESKQLLELYEELNKDRHKALEPIIEATSKASIAYDAICEQTSKFEGWATGELDLPVGERCSYCGQEISGESIKEAKLHYVAEWTKAGERKGNLKEEWETWIEKQKVAYAAWDKKITEAREKKVELEEVRLKQAQLLTEKEKEAEGFEADIERYTNEITHERKRLEEQKEDIDRLDKELEKKIIDSGIALKGIEMREKEFKAEEQCLEFWIEGFGNQGIKSLLLDEILPQLNNKVAYFASALMDEEISIEFDTEKTLKSGETRSKFDIKIIEKGKEFSYFNYSGGERQRIDVAIILALQSVIFERSAGRCNLVVFDEVFERLDSVGIERAINLLKEEADEKAIFVISHQNELKDYFDNILMIRNEKGVSCLEA